MIDADRITRVIAQRCLELTLTDLAAVISDCTATPLTQSSSKDFEGFIDDLALIEDRLDALEAAG